MSAQGEVEDEVNNQQMEKLDPRCITATASHSGQRVCNRLVGAACRLVRAAKLELLSQSCWVRAAICSARATPFRLRAVAIVRAARSSARATPFELRAAIVRAAWSGLLVAGSELLGRSSVERATQFYLLSSFDKYK